MTLNHLEESGSGRTQRVASFYSHSAEGYEEMWAPLLLKLSRDLVQAMPLDGSLRVLDLGCGVGTLLPIIQERAPDAVVVGSDIAHGMLARAPARFARVTSDAQRLPFAEDSFDATVLAFMLFHVPDPARALTETRRIVRTGAVVGTLTWGEDPPYLAWDVWNEELEARGAEVVPPLARHEFVDRPEKVTDLLEQAGFGEVRTWMGEHSEQQTLETFIAHRTGHGLSRHRFESLSQEQRAGLLESVRKRLADSGSNAFLDRSEVIYATATAL